MSQPLHQSRGETPDIEEIDRTEYEASKSFLRYARSNKAKGIFTTDVICACFSGRVKTLDDGNENTILLVGKVHECEFGLVVDHLTKTVVTGHVYRINGVRAWRSGEWDEDSIERMRSLGKPLDPETGNKQTWFGAEPEQKSYHDGEHPRYS